MRCTLASVLHLAAAEVFAAAGRAADVQAQLADAGRLAAAKGDSRMADTAEGTKGALPWSSLS